MVYMYINKMFITKTLVSLIVTTMCGLHPPLAHAIREGVCLAYNYGLDSPYKLIDGVSLSNRQCNNQTDNNLYSLPLRNKNNTHFSLRYLINNPSICSSMENLTIIVVIHSAIENFSNRLTIRQTWANQNHYNGFTTRTVFFLGQPTDERLQGMIQEESKQFGDIVQADFVDSYRNLTYKGVTVLHWISQFCENVEAVLKVDDDVFVNMFRIVELRLPQIRKHPHQIICNVLRRGKIWRDPGFKWSVKADELPADLEVYPTYCMGCIVLLTPDLVLPMLKNIPSNPFFWVDDVYIYGFLTKHLPVHRQTFSPRIPGDTRSCYHALQNRRNTPYVPVDACFNIPGAKEMVSMWELAIVNLPQTSLWMFNKP